MISGFNGEYAFLSNMYPCEIEYQGYKFPSSEHLYQWLKVPENETWWRDKIREAVHGKVAKKLAANPKCPKVENFYEDEKIRLKFMVTVIHVKFTKNEELKEKLWNTGDEELVETNYWNDTFWGVCNGVGRNMLGKLLMNNRHFHRDFHRDFTIHPIEDIENWYSCKDGWMPHYRKL